MPAYKLVYFDARGRAEPTRYAFAYKKVPFEDKRIKREEMAELKPTLPFGQLPVLYVDGTPICQSGAMLRYVARELGLDGKSNLEKAQVDAVYSCTDDLYPMLMPMFTAQEADKPKIMEELKNGKVKEYFDKVSKMLGDKPYFVGTEPTYADLAFASLVFGMSKFLGADYMAQWKNLIALQHKVDNLPGIKEWVAKRPDTQM